MYGFRVGGPKGPGLVDCRLGGLRLRVYRWS